MRSIRIEVPGRKAKLVLWEHTEDEESFEIKSLKRGTPYVVAYGIKYELTDEEIKYVRELQKLVGGIEK